MVDTQEAGEGPLSRVSPTRAAFSNELLHANGYAGRKRYPVHHGFLNSILIWLIGHRQSAYCQMEVIRDRRTGVVNETAKSRRELLEILKRHHTRVCESETELIEFVTKNWQGLELPHGAGAHGLPGGLGVYTDEMIKQEAAEEKAHAREHAAKRKKKKRTS